MFCSKTTNFLTPALLICILFSSSQAQKDAVGERAAPSASIVVHQVHTYSENNLLYLNATAAIALPAEVGEALNNGILLSFVTEIEILSPQPLLPDKRLAHFKILRKLRYHALTKKFIVQYPNNKTQKSFDSLRDA